MPRRQQLPEFGAEIKRRWHQRIVKPSKVLAYTSCPDCSCWSAGVKANGRIVRHTMGIGSVEKVGPGTRHPHFRPGKICTGSGKQVYQRLND